MSRDDLRAREGPSPGDNVFTLFERHAVERPEAVAVVADEGDVTYGELMLRADQICHALLARGLAAEQPVGVLMHRRADLLAVLLGVSRAGGAYVPLDPMDPPERVVRQLRAAGCSFVVGDQALLQALPAAVAAGPDGAAPPMLLDVAHIEAPGPETAAVRCAPGGARLAYLLFTSGSTGEPKAVEVEHRNVVALLQSAAGLLRFTARDRYLAASTVAFDASVTELLLPLVTGASLLLRDRTILFDPKRLAQDVRRFGVTAVQTSPSAWAVVIAEVPDFPRVRVLITHAEAVAPGLADRLCALGDEVWNLYGPTETTVWATGHRLSPHVAALEEAVPIGLPLPHVQALVVDLHGQPVPDGTQGELWLGGPSVARGYRGHETLTRERFVAAGGQRLYRSGDLVVRDAAGVLHYRGRNDEQMKIRGVRVEPGEVEAAILRQPGVLQAAVTWFDTPGGTRSIVAAVVLKPGVAGSAKQLHSALGAELSGAMVPSRYLFLPRLPLTTSGKVDRAAVRQSANRSEPGTQLDAPGFDLSATERALAAIWQPILGVDNVAPDDHFFAIGGDSLAAVHMLVEAEQLFGLQLPVNLAFEAPTLGALARRVDRLRERADPGPDHGFVFAVTDAIAGRPLFFSGVNLLLARPGLWAVPCPLYSIANWAKGSGFVQASSLPALAAAHVAGVQRVQPRGPYRLAGFSLGGLIALEMAQQLRAAGEEVELLFLLDPMDPPSAEGAATDRRPVWHDPLPQRVARYLRLVAAGPGRTGLRQWFWTLFPIGRLSWVEWASYQVVHHYGRRPDSALRWVLPRNRWRAFWFAARRMVQGYVARPYSGRTLAVFGEDGRRMHTWAALLGPQADLRLMQCPHDALFEEPARDRWMAWLDQTISTPD